MDKLIWKEDAIDAVEGVDWYHINKRGELVKGANSKDHEPLYKAKDIYNALKNLPSAQPERLTDNDFETIRIHLNAYKEKLCNLQRWKEAEEYQRIIDRFMVFASAHPKHGKWEYHSNPTIGVNLESAYCSCCGFYVDTTGNIDFNEYNFCPRCGAKMEE